MCGFIKMEMSFSYFILHRNGNVCVAGQSFAMHFALAQCIHVYLQVMCLKETLRWKISVMHKGENFAPCCLLL